MYFYVSGTEISIVDYVDSREFEKLLKMLDSSHTIIIYAVNAVMEMVQNPMKVGILVFYLFHTKKKCNALKK